MATYVPKTWTDELVEYPTRYKITHSDSTEEQVNIATDFGNETQAGDVFDAVTFNNLESRISAGFASVQDVLTGTSDPTSQQGKDGDTYYKTVTESNVTTIVGMFVKLSGEWLEISTGASLPQAEGGGF